MAQLDLITLLVWCFVSVLVLQTAVFIYAWKHKRLDVVDTFWGITFITIALTAAIQVPRASGLGWVVVGCVLVWGTRLAWHIGRRFMRSTIQDPRYTQLQQSWPTSTPALQAYVRIFVAQALLATAVSVPVVMAINSQSFNPMWLYAGLAAWIVGFTVESIADKQLKDFIINKQNTGRLMTSGLWRYSRHPNYFGELTQWWGIGLMVLGTSYGVLGMIGPVIITTLICFVSGIPPAERRSADRPGWAEYKRTTSAIIPWFKQS